MVLGEGGRVNTGRGREGERRISEALVVVMGDAREGVGEGAGGSAGGGESLGEGAGGRAGGGVSAGTGLSESLGEGTARVRRFKLEVEAGVEGGGGAESREREEAEAEAEAEEDEVRTTGDAGTLGGAGLLRPFRAGEGDAGGV